MWIEVFAITESLSFYCLDHLELAGGRRGTLGGLTEAFGNIHLNLRDDTGASGKQYHGTSFCFGEPIFFAGKIYRATPLYRYQVRTISVEGNINYRVSVLKMVNVS
jgi:hypothetical protein